jgi:hypothetical protein
MERRIEALPTIGRLPATGIARPWHAFRRLARGWNWRLSAHCRVASITSLWVIVLLLPVLGALAGPLLVLRFGTSLVQMALNQTLHRKLPIMSAPLGDWLLLALALAGATAAAAVEPGHGVTNNPLLLSLALAPFTAVQLRIAARSYRTAREASAPTAIGPFAAESRSAA